MKKISFCKHHKHKIQQSEEVAFGYWKMMMHQGVQAYTSCQSKEFDHYFNSAFEIAMLRYSYDNRRLFGTIHLMKPIEFLVTLHVQKNNFQEALLLLSTLLSLSDSENNRKEKALWIFLSEQYQYINDAQRKYCNDTAAMQPIIPHYKYSQAIH